jgi:DNA-binding CsgD family transcriptional regulator
MAAATDPDFWNPLDLLDRSCRAADPQLIWNDFTTQLSKAGFAHAFYAFGVSKASKQPCMEMFQSVRYLRGSIGHLDEFGRALGRRPDLLAKDPLAVHLKCSSVPFAWSCENLAAGEESVLSITCDFDIRGLFAFPLRNLDGSRYGSLVIWCTDVCQKPWLERARRFAPLLHITAQYLQDSLGGCDATPAESADVTLSPRQRECLLWTSRGLSTKQIADRLGLSTPVVHEYLSAAKRKLRCSTKSHAVARAIRLHLIEP